MSKYTKNAKARGAGSGIIPAGAVPMKRGIWDLYETTNPLIGLFDRCFWIEVNETAKFQRNMYDDALEDLSYFFDKNMKHNLIMIEFSNTRIMGGVVNAQGKHNAGECYRQSKKRNEIRSPKFPDTTLILGYELRFDEEDAFTFLTLWPGYEQLTSSNV